LHSSQILLFYVGRLSHDRKTIPSMQITLFSTAYGISNLGSQLIMPQNLPGQCFKTAGKFTHHLKKGIHRICFKSIKKNQKLTTWEPIGLGSSGNLEQLCPRISLDTASKDLQKGRCKASQHKDVLLSLPRGSSSKVQAGYVH
jgi:hypothetical protein